MAQYVEIIKVKAEYEIAESISKIEKLNLAHKNLKAQLEQLGKATKANKEERSRLNNEIKANKAQIDAEYRSIGLTGMSMNELKGYIGKLTAEYKKLRPASEDYIEKEKEIREAILETNKALIDRQKSIKVTGSSMDSASKSNSASLFGAVGAKVAGVIGVAMGAKEVISEIADIGNEYKKLDVVLDASLEHNKAKFGEAKKTIRSFSDDFGVNLGEVTETFVRMNNLGINPTRQALTQVSDFAIANKKTIQDYVEAIADAQTGENERLKEFGIKATKHGDTITYVYKGVATSVKNNAEAINEYLLGLGSLNSIAGTTAELGKSASAQWVKFQNVIKDVAYSVFNYFEPSVASAFKGLSTFARGISDLFDKTGALTRKYEEQRQSVSDLVTNTEPLLKRYDELKKKTNLSKVEQQELNKVIGEIGGVVPSAITEFDKLGQAMSINLGIVNEFVKKQKEATNKAKNELLVARRDEIKENGKHIRAIQEQLKTGQVVDYEIGIYSKTPKPRPLTDDEIRQNQKQLAEYQRKNKEAYESYKLLYTDKPLSQPSAPPPPKTQTTNTNQTDAEAKKQASLLQKRLENHVKSLETIAKNEAELIENEDLRKRTQLQNDYDHEMNALRKLLKDKELTLEDFNALSVSEKKKLDNGILKLDKETKDKETKANAEKLKKQNQAALESAKMVAEARLQSAEMFGTDEEILENKLAVNIVEERLAIFNAGELDHTAIHRKYAAQRAEITLAFAKKTQDEIAKVIKKKADEEEDEAKKKAQLEKEKAESLAKAKENFAQRTADAIQNTIFNNIQSGIDNELTQEDKKYQKLVELNAQRLANNEISQAEHDAKALELQEKHDAKVRELKRKQAVFDKTKALIDIAMNTAVNIVKAWAMPALIPWIVATGAIQAAAVASQPIPEFEAGIDDTGDGKKYPQANDGKGGFYSILHPNEAVVNAAEMPLFRAFKNQLANPQIRYPNVSKLITNGNQQLANSPMSAGSQSANYYQNSSASIQPEILTVLTNAVTVINELREQLKVPVPVKLNIGHKTAEDIMDTANEAKEIKTKSSAISAQ